MSSACIERFNIKALDSSKPLNRKPFVHLRAQITLLCIVHATNSLCSAEIHTFIQPVECFKLVGSNVLFQVRMYLTGKTCWLQHCNMKSFHGSALTFCSAAIDCFHAWLLAWLIIDWLVGWLVGWLIDWLINWLIVITQSITQASN